MLNETPRSARSEPSQTEKIDRTVGAALANNGKGMFHYNFDVVVREEKGQEDPRLRIGFDRGRLAACCSTVANALAVEPAVTHLALEVPTAHKRSTQALLASLVPPGLPAETDLCDLVDALNLADYLGLDEKRMRTLEQDSARRFKDAPIPALVRLLHSTSVWREKAMEKLLSDLQSATAHEFIELAKEFSFEQLKTLIKKTTITADQTWAIVSEWWLHHEGEAWPSVTKLLERGVGTDIRLDSFSDNLFNDFATHGCLTYEAWEDWQQIRARLSSVSERDRNLIDIHAGGVVFPARNFGGILPGCLFRSLPTVCCGDGARGKGWHEVSKVWLSSPFTHLQAMEKAGFCLNEPKDVLVYRPRDNVKAISS